MCGWPRVAIDLTREFKPIAIALLTVSDTRGADDDTSGDILAERIRTKGHTLVTRARWSTFTVRKRSMLLVTCRATSSAVAPGSLVVISIVGGGPLGPRHAASTTRSRFTRRV